MIPNVSTYIARHELLRPGDKVVVGVSGGADSIALLHVLIRGGYACVVAHCNFHLRGAESDVDEAFVKQTAATLQLPFYKEDFDTSEYARSRNLSVEMAARELRYRWFESLRQTLRAQAIAVGHHRDDSVETMLLNMIRGTGLRGLTGIRPQNGYVVRPLLCLNRSEIREWLSQQNLTYRTDSSNLSDKYTRNFIRLHILPLMEQLNPSVKETIARTAGHLSGVERLYEGWIEQERKRIMPDGMRVDIRELMLSTSPETVLYELLRPYGFTRTLAASVFASLHSESGKTFFTPDAAFRIIKDRDSLLLARPAATDESVYTIGENETLTQPIGLRTEKKTVDAGFTVERSASVASFDCEKLTFPLTLRKWRHGDWFVPFGMHGRKKLSDYFSDRKFSRIQKEQTWLLCNENDVIWIVGERSDERYKVTKMTKKALIVNFLIDAY